MHQGQIPAQDPRIQSKNAAKKAEGIDPTAVQGQAAPSSSEAAGTEAAEKKSKKEKPVKLVFKQSKSSPEEKMANLSKYFFDVAAAQPVVLGTVTGAVTGTVDD